VDLPGFPLTGYAAGHAALLSLKGNVRFTILFVAAPDTKGVGRLILATSLNHWRYAAIGAPGSAIRRLSYGWTLRRVASGDVFFVSGLWGTLGRRRAAVFIREGQPRVAVERHEWPLDASMTCRLARDGVRTRLELVQNGRVVSSVTYYTPRRPWQHWLEWPLDEEDYDFGSFIAKMIERQNEDPLLIDIWPFSRRLRGAEPTAA
jgi:hypothetical protein